MKLLFRKATLDDLTFLLALRKQTMDGHLRNAGLHYNDNQHRERVFDHFNDSLIIHADNTAIGLLKLARLPTRLHIRQLQILPEYQKQGFGTRVLQQVQQQALKAQLPLTLNVLHKNPALALYRRLGFELVGENPLEYQLCCSLATCEQHLQASDLLQQDSLG